MSKKRSAVMAFVGQAFIQALQFSPEDAQAGYPPIAPPTRVRYDSLADLELPYRCRSLKTSKQPGMSAPSGQGIQ